MEVEKNTIFYDIKGNKIGNDIGILPITLYKGMNITIHSYKNSFEVVDWNYHHGHSDENAGLHIILKEKE